MIYNDLLAKKKKIAVIGLGYVGLPLALEFARHFSVIAFDINPQRIGMMKAGIDPSMELEPAAFEGVDIHFTSDPADLRNAHFFVVAVPTDIDEHKVPNLKPLLQASETVGRAIKPGDYVVYESTVYPGCTEDDCLPIVEQHSGLKRGVDFKAGYSPERINPGDKERTLTRILKIVSGSDEAALEQIALTYGHIIEAGIYRAGSIRIAEAAKVIENAQRDINIAFVNELSMIFDRMGLETRAVLEAAGTKWNFLKFQPGLVGGHCIGVDPYYLSYKALQLGYNPEVILSGRRINDNMPAHVAKKLLQLLLQKGKNPGNASILIMGLTFKENVADIRNSKVFAIIQELRQYSMTIETTDPLANPVEVERQYGVRLLENPKGPYDAVIVAVPHQSYGQLSVDFFRGISGAHPLLLDLKGIFEFQDHQDITYWSM